MKISLPSVNFNFKSGLKYIGLGFFAYVAFLVTSFPAEQALNLVRDQLKGVYLQNVSGTAWNGRVGKLQVSDQVFEHVTWEVNFLSLATGSLQLDVKFDGAGRSGEGKINLGSDGSIGLRDFDAKVALMDIDHLLGIAPIELGGLAEVSIEELDVLGKTVTTADGVVRWKEAKATGPLPMELGNFMVTLSTEDEGVKGIVKDEGGAIQLDGVVKLAQDGNYQFNGAIAARDTKNNMLVQGIRALGRPGPDGRVAVDYSGRL